MKNMKPGEVSKEVTRRFLVLRQGFLQGRRGKEGTLEAIRLLECVQKDPISVVRCNHHLVLHNRVVDFKPSYLDELLYKDRQLFEYWCNAKSIIPAEDLPYFRYRMQNPSQFHSPFYECIKNKRKDLKAEIALVLSEIKKQGPLSAREFEQKRRLRGKMTTRVLSLLWDCGDLMIHHMDGNRRYYDLTERVLPPNDEAKPPSQEEYKRFMIQKYMRAYGLIDTRNWRFGWLSLKSSQRKIVVREMVEDDKLYPIKVEGVKHVYYLLDEHLSLLENHDTPTSRRIHFLAPLDNLLWNRRMISEIFDFTYTWEVYKVPEKRIYGYYVMPILYGTRLVGRLDPKLDRSNKTIIINTLLLEEKDFDKAFVSELAETMQRFLEFHDASQISVMRTKPRRLRDSLMRELTA